MCAKPREVKEEPKVDAGGNHGSGIVNSMKVFTLEAEKKGLERKHGAAVKECEKKEKRIAAQDKLVRELR